MAVRIPEKFEDLRTVYGKSVSSHVNIIGVVTEFKSPYKTKGTDWSCICDIADQTLGNLGFAGQSGLSVRCFNLSASLLPAVHGPGDVVVLKSVKVSKYREMKIVLTTRDTRWVVIPLSSIPTQVPANIQQLQIPPVRSGRESFPLSKEMMAYAANLVNSHDRSIYGGSAMTPGSASGATTPRSAAPVRDKFALVKDLEISRFYDLVGQVCKKFRSGYSECVELYITDYTGNELLWLNHDESIEPGYSSGNQKWPGPFGKLAMTVSLFPPHSEFAMENLEVDDYVFLRNVHIKYSRDSKMEGVLHTDNKYLDKVDITKLSTEDNDERLKDVMRRKLKYWKDYDRKNPNSRRKYHQEPTPPSESFNETLKAGAKRKAEDEKAKPLSRKAKKAKRQQEKEIEKAADAIDLAANDYNDKNDDGNANSTSTLQPSLKSSDPQMTGNVRCAHHTKPTRLISDIKSLDLHINEPPVGEPYTLPFMNINSRAKVRIIDFFPPRIENFCIRQPKKSVEYVALANELSSSSDDDDEGEISDVDGDHRSGNWTWAFQLLLEDATSKSRRSSSPNEENDKTRLWVTVAGADAEFLLKLDATDLSKNEQTCAALKERLFFMWGGLQERKEKGKENAEAVVEPGSQGAASQVFECCVKEYGVKVKIAKKDAEKTGEENHWSEPEDGEEWMKGEKGYGRDWGFERRWGMWGVTII